MKFGIVGCGVISAYYANAIREIEGSEIAGVFDANPKRGEKFAQENGAVFYPEYRLLLESQVDAVCICTPSGLHAQLAIEASNAGKHVVVEKPMGITEKQLDEIVAACKRNGTKLCAVSQIYFSDALQKTKACVEEVRLGKLLLGDITMKYFRSDEYYQEGGWRGTMAMDGGGALMNQGIHGVALLLYLMGQPKSVSAYARTLVHPIEVEDTAVACVEFQNGALGTITATTSITPGSPRVLNIHGTKGWIQLTDGNITRWNVEGEEFFVAAHDNAGTSENPTNFSHELHRRQLVDFIEAVQTGRNPALDENEGRKPVDLILAIYRSSQTGKPVIF